MRQARMHKHMRDDLEGHKIDRCRIIKAQKTIQSGIEIGGNEKQHIGRYQIEDHAVCIYPGVPEVVVVHGGKINKACDITM